MKGKWITFLCFFIGFTLCIYPIVSENIKRRFQEETVATYEKEAEKSANFEEIVKRARKYNEMLCQTKGAIVGTISDGILSDESYLAQLNMKGVMGVIEIPKIGVRLPIRHGTDEKTLASGVGHFRDSSLPVGGENTRCILTAHRGLPSAKLFTRLDEIEEGDLFYIEVGKEILAYEVRSIEVMEPEELDRLRIVAGKDIVSLVTCTPYGINTHRLVVSGERIAYKERVRKEILQKRMSLREAVFQGIPFLFIFLAAWSTFQKRKKRRKRNVRNEEIYDAIPSRIRSHGVRKRYRRSKRNRKHSH